MDLQLDTIGSVGQDANFEVGLVIIKTAEVGIVFIRTVHSKVFKTRKEAG